VLTHLHEALAVLGLGELRRALDETLGEPGRDETRLAWLWRLVEPQLRRRLESRAERRIREARLPVRKTFEAFNFAFQPKLDKDLVMELATLRFVAQGKNGTVRPAAASMPEPAIAALQPAARATSGGARRRGK
jgi:DNA replication protein DnaC